MVVGSLLVMLQGFSEVYVLSDSVCAIITWQVEFSFCNKQLFSVAQHSKIYFANSRRKSSFYISWSHFCKSNFSFILNIEGRVLCFQQRRIVHFFIFISIGEYNSRTTY